MHLGLVTYNLAADWDIPTIIKNCEAAKFEGVELRTTHAHKVEVNLSKEQREEVKKRFADSKVQLMGLGSAFDYHTPDQAKLRKDIEATKEYIVLAQDVGATGVKVRPNGFPRRCPWRRRWNRSGARCARFGDFARDHGQVIRLEVHGTALRSRRTSRRSSTWPTIRVSARAGIPTPPISQARAGITTSTCSRTRYSPRTSRTCSRRTILSQTAHAPERDQLQGLLPGRDSGQHRPGTGDEVLPGPVAGLPGPAVALRGLLSCD